MTAIVKNRVAKQLSWPVEEAAVRRRRRAALYELDGLLAQLEEINVRGQMVPAWVRQALLRHGIPVRPHHTAPEMIEFIFLAQEQYMLRPAGAAEPAGAGCPRDLEELRRRLAS